MGAAVNKEEIVLPVKDEIVATLSRRITTDIGDALKYVEVHEIVGLLEMIKMSICMQVVSTLKNHKATCAATHREN